MYPPPNKHRRSFVMLLCRLRHSHYQSDRQNKILKYFGNTIGTRQSTQGTVNRWLHGKFCTICTHGVARQQSFRKNTETSEILNTIIFWKCFSCCGKQEVFMIKILPLFWNLFIHTYKTDINSCSIMVIGRKNSFKALEYHKAPL